MVSPCDEKKRYGELYETMRMVTGMNDEGRRENRKKKTKKEMVGYD